jgi:hypothetical protein
MKKALIVALMMVAGIAQASDVKQVIVGFTSEKGQPTEDWDCYTIFDRKILGCDSSQSCKETKPKIEACIIHLQSVTEFCKTSDQVGVCYRGGKYRQSQLIKLNDRLPKYPEYIAYYEGVEAEKAVKDAAIAEKQRIENEKYEAQRKIEQAKEQAVAKKAEAAQAVWAAKEKQRLASCNPGDPYVGMSERSLNNLCKQTRWEGSTDYGSVKYTHYRTGYARVTVRNGVVAIVSY